MASPSQTGTENAEESSGGQALHYGANSVHGWWLGGRVLYSAGNLTQASALRSNTVVRATN
jgi:hypothetical protein